MGDYAAPILIIAGVFLLLLLFIAGVVILGGVFSRPNTRKAKVPIDITYSATTPSDKSRLGQGWWEHLIFAGPQEDVITCPSCAAKNSSIDVVCKKDTDTILVGLESSGRGRQLLTLTIHVLRAMLAAAALAAGYLAWWWPAYAFGGIVIGGFLALFLRRHSATLLYFLLIGTLGLVGQAAWHMLDPLGLGLLWISGVILIALFLPEPLFLICYTLRVKKRRAQIADAWDLEGWIMDDVGPDTLMWIAFMLTATVLCLVVVAGIQWIPLLQLGGNVRTLGLSLGLSALGSAEGGALIASTIYTLSGEPFQVPDRWRPPKLKGLKLKRMTVTIQLSSTRFARLMNALNPLAVALVNGIIRAVEDGCNNFVVRFVNDLADGTVRLLNATWRAVVKLARHTERSVRRLAHLNVVSGWWAWMAGKRYAEVFMVPPILWWLTAMLLYEMSHYFLRYIHEGPVTLPLVMAAQGLLIMILLTVCCSLLLHVSISAFRAKVLNALVKFGPNAYLFFVLTAWLLGLAGVLTNGPYRIGWVTITSTLLLAVVVFATQWRGQESPETAAREWLEALRDPDSNKLNRTCSAQQANIQSGIIRFSSLIEADILDLRFVPISQSTDTAQVLVTGEIRTAAPTFAQTQLIHETWQMIWEDDKWKWCGKASAAEESRKYANFKDHPKEAFLQELLEVIQPPRSFEPEMVPIRAGEFLMGSDPQKDKNADDAEQPQHKLYLPGYYMAKMPTTNAEYAVFVEAAGHKPPEHWEGEKPPQGKEDHPVVCVSWDDAMVYCKWLAEVTGKLYRLPSEAEWEKGARGTDGRIYPWGNEWDAGRCNAWEGGKNDTTPVKAYPQGGSPYGLLDMAGNVWEWCHSLYRQYPYDALDGREDPEAEGDRVARGGAILNPATDLRCTFRVGFGPDGRDWCLGFRVVVAPGFRNSGI
jgi:formylglycine-generating enzyme required for sulfatase activity